MKVVIGLGNPGSKYRGTRHNVGYAVVDSLAAGSGVGKFQDRFQAEIAEWASGTDKIMLVKPTTFMNLSGRSVRQLVDFYQLPHDSILVVCDDVNLPLGMLRFRAKGTHGGHNGLRDIQSHLGTTDYARLRIGVDAPGQDEMVNHVLGRFKPGERDVVEAAVATAAQGVDLWVREGIQECMNQYNKKADKGDKG
jgi:peptidyl-tRNA hydrolase, PTH1 family